jgi:hypothetical protein
MTGPQHLHSKHEARIAQQLLQHLLTALHDATHQLVVTTTVSRNDALAQASSLWTAGWLV